MTKQDISDILTMQRALMLRYLGVLSDKDTVLLRNLQNAVQAGNDWGLIEMERNCELILRATQALWGER